MLDREKISGFMIFENLDSEDLDTILQLACQSNYKTGDIILEEDESKSGSDLFIVLKGMVKVELDTTGFAINPESSKRLAVLKDGAIFGEIGLLRRKSRSARLTAYSDVSLMRIDQRKLYNLLESNHRLGYQFMRNLAVILSERLVDVNFMWRNSI